MKKRFLFHLLNFLILNVLIFAAVYVYYATSYPSWLILYSVNIAYDFVLGKLFNFLLISFLTYFLCYLTGIIKFTIEEKFFKFVPYLREVFKLLLILGMVSFVEFFLFYDDRIGRLIYVYIFILFSLYYYVYRVVRWRRGPRELLWMAIESAGPTDVWGLPEAHSWDSRSRTV